MDLSPNPLVETKGFYSNAQPLGFTDDSEFTYPTRINKNIVESIKIKNLHYDIYSIHHPDSRQPNQLI